MTMAHTAHQSAACTSSEYQTLEANPEHTTEIARMRETEMSAPCSKSQHTKQEKPFSIVILPLFFNYVYIKKTFFPFYFMHLFAFWSFAFVFNKHFFNYLLISSFGLHHFVHHTHILRSAHSMEDREQMSHFSHFVKMSENEK